jgi:O-antigen/teichoic acid export membrane protein
MADHNHAQNLRLQDFRGRAAASTALTAFAQFAGLIAIVIASRRMGTAAMGTYTFCFGVTTYFMLPTNFGFASTAIRDVASRQHSYEVTLSEMLVLQTGVALLLYLVLFLLSDVIGPTAATRALLPISGLQLFSTAITVDWALQASRKIVPVAVCRFLSQIIYVALVVVVVHGPGDVTAFTVANLIGWFWFAGATLVIGSDWSLKTFRRVRVGQVYGRVRRSLGVGYAQSMVLVYYYADVLLLQYLKGSSEVGIYGVATRIPLAFIALLGIWTRVVLPRASLLAEEKRLTELRHELEDSAGAAVAIACFVAVMSFFVSSALIHFLFGPQFAGAAAPFSVLMIAAGLILVATNFTPSLIGLDDARWFAIAATCGAVVNLGLNFALIPSTGAVGAAWATVAAEAVVLAIAIARVSQRLGRLRLNYRPLAFALAAIAILGLVNFLVKPALETPGVLVAAIVETLIAVVAAFWMTRRRVSST